MSTVYTAAYTTLVRDQLQDVASGTEVWTDLEIADHVQRAIKDVSQYRPYLRETVLVIQDDSKDIDISSLSDRVYIDRVDYYPDRTDRRWRNWTEHGDWLTMDLDWTPSIDTVGTLTGTITFTKGSQTVTGSGSDFDGELTAKDHYIRASAGTNWYRVLNIASDTSLTIDRPFMETTVTDTVSLTQYRDYTEVARIYWAGMHTVTTTASTLPTELEQLVVDGACAYTLRAYASEAREMLDDSQDAIALANTQLDLINAQMTLLVADVALGRSDIEKQITAAATAIGKVITNTAAADTYMNTGDDFIPTVNVGSNVAGGYLSYAQGEMQQAMNYLQEYQAHITEGGKIIGEDLAVASGELRAVQGYIQNAGGFFSEAASEVRTAQAILQHSTAEADRREALFRDALKRAQGRKHRTPKNDLLPRS